MTDPLIAGYIAHHERFLTQLIAELDSPAPLIKDAISYSLLSGGKRLRPSLIYLSDPR